MTFLFIQVINYSLIHEVRLHNVNLSSFLAQKLSAELE